MKFTTNKFGAIFPESHTKSFENFYSQIIQSDLLITLLLIMGDYISDNKDMVRQKMLEIAGDLDDETITKWNENLKSENGDIILNIDSYQDFYGQMCFARIIENMLSYFKEILGEVIIKKPQVLKSKETERLDFILDFDNINDLRAALAEKKVEALFYAGFDTIDKFFQERLGIKIFKSEEQETTINQAIKYRHLIVHNRGIVTKDFLKLFPETGISEGEYLKILYADISEIHVELNNFVANLDAEIAEKFGLEVFTRE